MASDSVTRVVARLQQGDPTGSVLRDADRILRRSEPAARQVCRSHMAGASPEQIDELVQETLELVWKKFASFEDQGKPFEAWVRGIARNVCNNARRRRTELLSDDGLLEPTDPELDVLRVLGRHERAHVLTESIAASLQGVEQDVLYHRYIHGLGRDEIAELLGLASADEVRVVLQRAGRRLKAELRRRLIALGHGDSFLHTRG